MILSTSLHRLTVFILGALLLCGAGLANAQISWGDEDEYNDDDEGLEITGASIVGWEPEPAVSYYDTNLADTGAGLFMSLYLGHHWLTGQLEEVFVEGGIGAGVQLGVSWERWIVSFDTGALTTGSRFPNSSFTRIFTGINVTHRIPLSWTWALTVGVGGHFNWMSYCRADNRPNRPQGAPDEDVSQFEGEEDTFNEEETCLDTEEGPLLKHEGFGLDVDIGLSWTMARAQDDLYRVRTDFFTKLRVTSLWLENDPALSTVQGVSLLWMAGAEFDFDFFE